MASTQSQRRRRSPGLQAPQRKPPHTLGARLWLHWQSLYPMVRMVVVSAVCLAVGYAVVALIWILPSHPGFALWTFGPAALFVFASVALTIFSRGEPNDQTHVHAPRAHHMSDAQFNRLEDRVERLAATSAPPEDREEFAQIVRDAIDDLPPEFSQALDHVAVTISDQGAVQRINGRLQPLYGLYTGYQTHGNYVIGAPAGSPAPDRIVIFRDTLEHSFGHDPARLREEVTRTLRHELGHHLGYDEEGVRALGL
jgi:predicted Zn-dependent protease with MMP-like domain